jgi:hypothetical protein
LWKSPCCDNLRGHPSGRSSLLYSTPNCGRFTNIPGVALAGVTVSPTLNVYV